jgi:hypothetical protein
MRWTTAVKMWNMHKKIYVADHVYAIPRRGTAEYDDVMHITKHEALPSHLHKKAPLPDKVIQQLRQQERDAKERMEQAKKEVVAVKKEMASVKKEVKSVSELSPKELAEHNKAETERIRLLNARPIRVRLEEAIQGFKDEIAKEKRRKASLIDHEHIADLEAQMKRRVDYLKTLKD